MDFSIIIPTKNERAALTRTLPQFDALRGHFSYEVIIADGMSDDGTIEYARSQSCRVEVKTKQERETIGEGRNRGAAAAHGDILAFFDADVRIPDVVRFFTAAHDAFQDGRIVGATAPVVIYPEQAIFKDTLVHGVFNAMVRGMIFFGFGGAKGEAQLIRRSAFREIGGFNEKLWAGEDFDLFRRLSKKGKIVFLAHVKVTSDPRRFRVHGYTRTLFRWFRNDMWVRLFGRSYDVHWDRVDAPVQPSRKD